MAENRCERCNRVISDPNAQYGWRCAEIMGVSQDLNYAGDEAFRAFLLGIAQAEKINNEKKLATAEKNALYETMVKRYLSADMHNARLWEDAYNDSLSVSEKTKSKSLSEYIQLRDNYDYSNGTYTTTDYLEDTDSKDIQKLQHALNEIGIRDRFGNRLIEDGLYGPKTQWANDVLVKGLVPILTTVEPLQTKYTKVSRVDGIKNIKSSNTLYRGTNRVFAIENHEVKHISGDIPFNHINVETGGSYIPWNKKIADKLNHMKVSDTTYAIFKDFDKLESISKKGGKALSVVGYMFDAYEFGTAVNADIKDNDNKISKSTYNSAAGIAGSWTGSAIGAKVGAWGGAALGTVICPGLGTAIGGFIGGAVGGMTGSYAGRQIGEDIVNDVYDMEEIINEQKKKYQH